MALKGICSMTLTLTDLFCGAGGSSTGAVSVPGVTVRIASNHWDLAVETHNTDRRGHGFPGQLPHPRQPSRAGPPGRKRCHATGMTGLVLRSAAEMHEPKHGHIVDILEVIQEGV